MTTKRILQRALKLFGPDGENWTNKGLGVERKHCAITAIYADVTYHDGHIAEKAVLQANNIKGVLSRWNDAHTWPEVKAAFENTILEAGQ